MTKLQNGKRGEQFTMYIGSCYTAFVGSLILVHVALKRVLNGFGELRPPVR